MSDRSRAKSGIVTRGEQDAELNDAISSGHEFQLELARENNDHERKMLKITKGLIGRFFGSEGYAATFAAIIALILSIIFAGICASLASHGGPNVELWKQMIEKSLTFATAALGFIFGRSSSK